MKHIVTLVCCFLVVLSLYSYGNRSIPYAITLLGTEDCTNGIDDDGDGKIDHLDPDCNCQEVAGKNYVSNSDFEAYKECCFEISHDDCFNHWRSIVGTPDYYSKKCQNPVSIDLEVEEVFKTTLAGSAIHFGGIGSYMESIGTCLLEATPDQEELLLSVDLVHRDINDFTVSKQMEGTFYIYGWYDCSAFKSYFPKEKDCFSDSYKADAEVLMTIDLAEMSQGKWYSLSKPIQTSKPIQAITIQTDCNASKLPSGIHFLMDNVEIRKKGTTWSYEDNIKIENSLCDEQFYMKVKDSVDLNYQWYKDGVPIAGATSNQLNCDKNQLDVTGQYHVAIINTDGCYILDSMQVHAAQHVSSQVNETICAGDSIFFNNSWIHQAGVYNYLGSTAAGCDSTVVLNLDVEIEKSRNIEVELCPGESYVFQDSVLDSTGSYLFDKENITGCDSVFIVDVLVQSLAVSTEERTICEGSTYVYQDSVMSKSGTYDFTHTTAAGCDSIHRIKLNVTKEIETKIDTSICSNSYYLFAGDTLRKTGVYQK